MTLATVRVRQRVRPTRHAFIVDATDIDAILRAASLSTALWGGVYNPIVPRTPREQLDGLVRAFDPDVLVHLASGDLPVELAQRYRDRALTPGELVQTDERTSRRHLGLGFNILPLLRHVHETEVRFSVHPTRAVLLAPEDRDGWMEFAGIAFGSFQWLPEQGVDFQDVYTRALNASTVSLPALTAPDQELLFPLDFTRHGLRLFGGFGSFSSDILYVGDHRSALDLLEFWNIRATGRKVVFLPIAAYRAFESWIRRAVGHYTDRISTQLEEWAEIQKGPSISDVQFEEVCGWISTLNVGPVAQRSCSPRFGVEMEGYVGDIHVAGLEAADGEELSILDGGTMTPVKLVAPPFLSDTPPRAGRLTWSVDITMQGGVHRDDFLFSFPSDALVEGVVRRATFRMPGDVRLGRKGIVLLEDSPRSMLHLRPIRMSDVIHALLRGAGLESKASHPGQYAEQIIHKMGSLQFGCRVFKVKGVRDVLHRVSNGSILTQGNMYQEVRESWRADLYDDLFLRPDQALPLNFTTIFNVLLEKRVLRPGFELQCPTCFQDDWYHVSKFTEEYMCRFCFTSHRVPFAAKKEWQYKADGLFQIRDGALGSLAVILSLWRLQEFGHPDEFGFVTSRDLTRSDGTQHEVDFACIRLRHDSTAYELILGEAKTTDFTEADIEKLAALADRFPGKPYLAYSTLKDRFSDQERGWLRNLASRDYGVIALTREEHDPYDLHDRFRTAPHPHAWNCSELSRNTLQLNLSS